MNDNLRLDIARLEAKLDVIITMLSARSTSAHQDGVVPITAPIQTTALNVAEAALLRFITTKQHCTSQLVMRGWKNKEIAELMSVSENTVKLHVSAISKKMGVKTRGQIAITLKDILDRTTEGEYESASKGLPITWADTVEIGKSDPLAPLYAPQRKEVVT
jgi:DNA-binding CsgD family transcriptional regulator